MIDDGIDGEEVPADSNHANAVFKTKKGSRHVEESPKSSATDSTKDGQ